MNLKIDPNSSAPKYQQIVDGFTQLIEAGEFKVGDKMPSIDKVSLYNKVAKETVVKAYRFLKTTGIIDSTEKKGFYILSTNTQKQWRVLVLFNILSPSKEVIYQCIVNTLGNKAHVDLLFHNYNSEIFQNLIKSKAAAYHYFIVMPHYDNACTEVLNLIPPERLFILDRPLKHHIQGASSVHQDFRQDVYNALNSQRAAVLKYRRLIVVFPASKNLPEEIIEGIRMFALENKMSWKVVETAQQKLLVAGTLFITPTDDALIELIELQQKAKLKLGKDIGIISYNENPLKRILAGGITTISSDFAKMGTTVAELILKKESRFIHNSFNIIKRKSL